MRFLGCVILLCFTAAVADCGAIENDSDFQYSGNAQFWAYGTGQQRVGNSIINPENRVADLYDTQLIVEKRINLQIESEKNELVLRPRLLQQYRSSNLHNTDSGEVYLSEGFWNSRLNNAFSFTAGRKLFSWGPANFRSPSNPIYFDAGKTNPLRDVSGVDLVNFTYSGDSINALLGQVQTMGHLDDGPSDPMSIAKIDWHDRDMLASFILAGPVYDAPFYGSFIQATLNESWMVYGEVGSGKRAQSLSVNPSSVGSPFLISQPSSKQTTLLLGVSHTLENGQSISLEALHDDHGFDTKAEHSYFDEAASLASQFLIDPKNNKSYQMIKELGRGLSSAPLLFCKDYSSILWQSNPQETGKYWRINWIYNLQDSSSQLILYGEKEISGRISVFSTINYNFGDNKTDFGRLSSSMFTFGIKCFIF